MPYDDDIEYIAERETSQGMIRRPGRWRIAVIHQDDDLLVISKPAGVWIDQSPDDEAGVLEQLGAAGLLKDDADSPFVYPLDPAVSGLMLLPRTAEAARSLDQKAQDCSLNITCLAIVRGPVMQDQGEAELNLAPLPRGAGGRMKIDKRGSPARVSWKVLDRFIGYALLECRPAPAFPHQVRPLLEAAGLPLAVDPLYGGSCELMLSSFKAGYRPSKRREERPLLDRVSMHVGAAEFRQPGSEADLRWECPPPKDFRAALHQLDRFGRMPR